MAAETRPERTDPRGDPAVIESLIRASRRAQRMLSTLVASDRVLEPPGGDDEEEPAALALALRTALGPIDEYDADDSDDATSRYAFGCGACSMCTDADGFDRDGDEHGVCLECEEIDGEGCTAGSMHAEHVSHQAGECFVDEDCQAPEWSADLRPT